LSNTIITSAGLNWITSASTLGPFISIKYFLPVYDYRADPNVHNQLTTSAIDTSAAMSPSDTSPTGEIIYNIDAKNHSYSLSKTNHYVLSAGGETLDDSGDPWILTNAVISVPQSINLYDGIPLSNQIYGANGVDASATTNAWEIYGGELIAGNNTVPAETSAGTDRYFKVDGYYPTSASGLLKGSFKCRLSKNIGSVKFNKIALYAIRVNENGQEIGNPALFAEAMMTNPVVKTNYGTEGFDDIVIDVQLTISTITSAWNDVFYSTSGDYWNLTPNGLYYQGNVGIGDFNDGAVNIPAKLDIRSESEKQLRLTRNSTQYAEFYFDSAGQLIISATNSSINTCSLVPITNVMYNLGSSTKHWYQVHLYTLKNVAETIYCGANFLPESVVENYNIGSTTLRWNTFYGKGLDILGTFSCQDIIPKTSGVHSLGNSSHTFESIYTDVIRSKYIGTHYGSNIYLLTNLLPNSEYTNLGTPATPFNQIYGTNGIFTNIYGNGRSTPIGVWTTCTINVHESTDPNSNNAAINREFRYMIIGKTVYLVGYFTLTTGVFTGTQYLHLVLPEDDIGRIYTGMTKPYTFKLFCSDYTEDLQIQINNSYDQLIAYRPAGNFGAVTRNYWFTCFYEIA